MHPKRAANFPLSEPHLLLLSTLLLVSMFPNAAHGAVDVLRSFDASGVRAQLVDLDMHKLGDGIEPTQNVYARDIDGFENQLITNGEDSLPKQFKYQAALLINTSVGFFQICGAAIISEHHALTAAHCLPYLSGEKNNSYDHFIAVGMLNLSQGLANPGSQIVSVVDFLIHMDYGSDKPGYPNDLAILSLDPPIVQNDYVQFAEIARPSMGNFAQTYCVVSGWGLTEDGDTTLLQWGYQYIPTPRDCKNFWAISRTARITKRHICGYLYPVQVCSGDSGGPLMCDNVVAGIVSWGLANCSGCFPGIYTRVSFHYRWILWAMQQVVKK